MTAPNKRDTQAAAAQQSAPTAQDDDASLIAERLSWSPSQRLRYLLDMLAFEERAHRAVRLPRKT